MWKAEVFLMRLIQYTGSTHKLDIDLPVGAVAGDKLIFTVVDAVGATTTYRIVLEPRNPNFRYSTVTVTVPRSDSQQGLLRIIKVADAFAFHCLEQG